MILEIQTQWADALVSKEFKQGKKVLRSQNDNFCCLGVLCELYRRVHLETSRWEKLDEGAQIFVIEGSPTDRWRERVVPPPPVLEWLTGRKYYNPIPNVRDVDGFLTSVIVLNDERHRSFDQIALAIRQAK